MEGFAFFDAFRGLDISFRKDWITKVMAYVKEDQYLFCLAMTCKSFFSAVCRMHWKVRPSHLKRVPVLCMFKRCELNVLRYLESMNFVARSGYAFDFDHSIATLEEWRRISDYVQDHMLVGPGSLMLTFVENDFVEMIEYAIHKKWHTVDYFDQYFNNAQSVKALDLIADIVPSHGLRCTEEDFWSEAHFVWWLQNMHREQFTKEVFFENVALDAALERAEGVCSFTVLKPVVSFMCSGPFQNRPACSGLGNKVKMLMHPGMCTCGDPANHDPKNLRPKKRLKC